MNKQKKEAIALAKNSRALNGLDLAKEVTVEKSYQWEEPSYSFNNHNANRTISEKYHVVVYDFGVKQQILKLLVDRGCAVTVVPAQTTVTNVLKLNPDGILLSNGPGDPQACGYAITATKDFINKNIPVFGICLGFQILGLALGARTEKMKFGHHGGNHPVQDVNTKKVLITSQNHGFMVVSDSISKDIEITHRSLFDKTIQGIRHKTKPAFGFQGHPEASPGPNDIEYLFDVFIDNIAANKINFSKDNHNINRDIKAKAAVVQTGQ